MVTRIDDRRKNKRYPSTASDDGIIIPITDNIANDKPIVRNEVFQMTEQIGESSQTSSDEAKERARRSGIAKGTAGADETGSEYEQGAAGANK